ncbi:MAG: hypothetical protein ABI207_08635, partial [Crocinitomicaceae bacterium]
STIFYVLLAIDKKKPLINYLKQALLGLIAAILFSIICYFLFLKVDDYGVTFHVVTIVLCYSFYFGLKRIIKTY